MGRISENISFGGTAPRARAFTGDVNIEIEFPPANKALTFSVKKYVAKVYCWRSDLNTAAGVLFRNKTDRNIPNEVFERTLS